MSPKNSIAPFSLCPTWFLKIVPPSGHYPRQKNSPGFLLAHKNYTKMCPSNGHDDDDKDYAVENQSVVTMMTKMTNTIMILKMYQLLYIYKRVPKTLETLQVVHIYKGRHHYHNGPIIIIILRVVTIYKIHQKYHSLYPKQLDEYLSFCKLIENSSQCLFYFVNLTAKLTRLPGQHHLASFLASSFDTELFPHRSYVKIFATFATKITVF